MDRAEALKILASETRTVPPGQRFTAAFYEDADGPAVARLFYAVYGDAYPIDTYYIPEQLSRENAAGNIRSVVARTAAGDVVAHIALFRSSAPNPNLYEFGLGLSLPQYRNTTAFFRASELLMKLVGTGNIDGFFGEAVCNHTATQKLCKVTKSLETAVEPALMPHETYTVEGTAKGRVGCLVFSRVARDVHKILYVPAEYRVQIALMLDGLALDRHLVAAEAPIPAGKAEIDVARFGFASVARCKVLTPGDNLDACLTETEAALRNDRFVLMQFFVDLGQPWAGALVTLLRRHGYSLGGLMPAWFGSDGLLMQKHFVDPDFAGMKILDARGQAIVDMARRDWEMINQAPK